jgi:hypothetical protein
MTDSTSIKEVALTTEELEHVVGGIIIVGGLPILVNRFVSPLDKVSINPQPLPPRYLSLGIFGH